MGDTLSKPVTEKHSSSFENSSYSVGACGMQGWRKNMEDAHVVSLNFGGTRGHSLFGVFDGHNGQAVAKYASEHVGELLLASDKFKKGEYGGALQETFIQLDDIMATTELRHDGSGCTAVSVLISESKLTCANAGDSRAVVLTKKGEVIPLSYDHKPTMQTEIDRIEKAGGVVTNGRVNGTLALTRALGDFDFKTTEGLPPEAQMITSFPDVIEIPRNDDIAFMILACDGVWDVMSNEQACQFVQTELPNHDNDPCLVCEQLLDKCLAPAAPGLGCDNMTVVIVLFK